jgi:hypothetical protein
MTREDIDYLTHQLADSRDWPGLWHLVRDLSLADAVAAMRLFDGGWQPAGDGARRLFDLLAATRPESVARAIVRLTPDTVKIVRPSNINYGCSFSPDGTEIAVSGNWTVGVYTIASGRRVRHRKVRADRVGPVLHVGSAIIYVDQTESLGARTRIVRYRRGRVNRVMMTTYRTVGSPRGTPLLAHVPGGFVAAHGALLRFGGSGGPWRREVSLAELEIDWPVSEERNITAIATDLSSGRLAVAVEDVRDSTNYLVVLDAALRPLGQARRSDVAHERQMAFCGPDRLITSDARFNLRSWRVGPDLEIEGTTRGSYFWVMPSIERIAVCDAPTIRYVAARTLTRTDTPLAFQEIRSNDIRGVSPCGAYAATQVGRAVVEVHDLRLGAVAELVGRPLADTRPADLATVTAAEARDLSFEVRAAVRVLRACLEYRFGVEAAPGATTPRAIGGVDGIALSGNRDAGDGADR